MKFLTLEDPKDVKINKETETYCDWCREQKVCLTRSTDNHYYTICEDCIQQLSELIKV